MNIIFMGSPDFAVPSLEALHQSDHSVVAVVSNIDKRRGRGTATAPTPVKAKAIELGLPVIEVEDLNSEAFTNSLKSYKADLFVVVAFRVLPKQVLEIPSIGSINLHASLLPKYRGAAPIHWAIINGEKESGCTIFFLDEKVDTGNILTQKRISIGEDETTGSLYERLMAIGSVELVAAVDRIASGDYTLQQQDDELATPAPKLFKENTHIDFQQEASRVHNLIRGLNPFPKAWAYWKDEVVKIYKSRPGPIKKMNPGELIEVDGRLLVGCKNSTLELLELQLPGKKIMTAEEFLNGYTAEGILS